MNQNKPIKAAKAAKSAAPAQGRRQRSKKKKQQQMNTDANYKTPERADQKFRRILKAQIGAEDDAVVRAYASHIVDPEGTNPCGVPIQSVGLQPTGLINSALSFDVTANFSGTGNDVGRFGFIVRPDLGDASKVNFFKVAMVDNNQAITAATPAGWPADLSQTNSYVRNVGKRALTVDPNSRSLLQGPATYLEGFGSDTAAFTSGPLGLAANYVTNSTTDDLQNPAFGASPTVTFPAVGTSRITLPPGQFLVSLESVYQLAPNTTGSNFVITPSGPNVSVSSQNNIVSNISVDSELVVSVYNTSGYIDLTWDVQPTVAWGTDLTITSSWARPDQLTIPAPGYPLDGGPVREYTPVAMSVFCSFIASPLTVAGDIATSLLPPNVCETDAFTIQPRSQSGNPLYVEDLRSFPQRYDGPLKDGSYTIWTPSGPDDMILRSPSSTRDRHFPCIAVSGKASSSQTAAAVPILRVLIVTTYQFSSDARCFDLKKRFGSQQALEASLRLINTFPRCGPNGAHWEALKEFFRRVGGAVKSAAGFVKNNQSWIVPAVETGLSLL